MPAHQRSGGFSLIELLAVCAVIALVSGLILVSNSTFGGKVLLENLAYDMALSVRQAQVYGIAVQRYGASTFNIGYGMHFDTANYANYVLFGDGVTLDGMYNCPGPGNSTTCEAVQSTAISNGFRIQKFCVTPSTGGSAGVEDCTAGSYTSLDIFFIRPNPDACISVNGASNVAIVNGLEQCVPLYSNARVVVKSPRGDLSSVLVDQNGQISVQQSW